MAGSISWQWRMPFDILTFHVDALNTPRHATASLIDSRCLNATTRKAGTGKRLGSFCWSAFATRLAGTDLGIRSTPQEGLVALDAPGRYQRQQSSLRQALRIASPGSELQKCRGRGGSQNFRHSHGSAGPPARQSCYPDPET